MTISRKAIHAQIATCLLACLVLGLGLEPTGIAQTAPPSSFGNITGFAGMQNNAMDSSSSPAAPALSTPIGSPSAVVTDGVNVYFADPAHNVVWEVYQGDAAHLGLISLLLPGPYTPGYAYAVVNTGGSTCAAGSGCGDGGLATAASLNLPSGLAWDNSKGLYIADKGSQAIRLVDPNTGLISTIVGDPNHQTAGYSGEGVTALGSLLNGPTSVVPNPGAPQLFVADSGNNIIRVIDNNSGMISTFAGTPPSSGGIQFPCTAAPCGDGGPATSAKFAHLVSIFHDGTNLYATDAGAAAIRKIDTQQNIGTVAGTLLAGAPFPDTCAPGTTQMPANCGDGVMATSALLNSPASTYVDAGGNLYIVDSYDNAVRRVDTTHIIQTVVGQLSSAGGYEGGEPGPAESAQLNHPYGIAFCLNVSSYCRSGVFFVTDQNNNIVRQVTKTALLKQQTLAFTQQPPAATYGDKPIDLSVYVSSTDTNTSAPTGLSARFFVTSGQGSISGSMLTITGAGPITVQASQAGNDTYAPATPVSATISVAQATLTLTADATASLVLGNPIVLANLPYTITGYVNSDSASVLTGSPALAVTDADGVPISAGAIPPVGFYPIVISMGNLSNPNYKFAFVNGTLLVTKGEAQTLAFGSYTPPAVYGDPHSTFSFSVTSSAGQTVVVAGTGPVKVQQITNTTWTATVMGSGQVTLNATQAGNFTYVPATAMAQFIVNQAVLTIPLTNATRQFNTQNPQFTYGTPTGFVGTDNSSVLSGSPSYTTTATLASDAGVAYPINASPGTLSAANYTFMFVPATLTITPATQQIIDFTAPANVSSLSGSQLLEAVATSGGPIVYSATGVAQITADDKGFLVTGVGPATITATQAGSVDYAPVSSTVSFNVAQITQYVSAVDISVPFGAAIPQLNWCWAANFSTGVSCSGSSTPPADLYSGVPAVTTPASQGSPAGTYPISVAAGTLTSSVYSFIFGTGTLTITPASTYTLSVNPSSVTVPNGQSRQVTITLTPVNNFAGTVSLACSGLPAGVTCTVSPANLTTNLNFNGISNPVSGTLTISANQVVAQKTSGDAGRLLAAGTLSMPGVFAGVLIFYRRRQFKKHSLFTGLFILLVWGVSVTCISACGGGSSHSGEVKAGTTQIMITGSGIASAGSALSESVGLSVTVQ